MKYKCDHLNPLVVKMLHTSGPSSNFTCSQPESQTEGPDTPMLKFDDGRPPVEAATQIVSQHINSAYQF